MKLPIMKIAPALALVSAATLSAFGQYESLLIPKQIQYQGRVATAAGGAWSGTEGYIQCGAPRGETQGLVQSLRQPTFHSPQPGCGIHFGAICHGGWHRGNREGACGNAKHARFNRRSSCGWCHCVVGGLKLPSLPVSKFAMVPLRPPWAPCLPLSLIFVADFHAVPKHPARMLPRRQLPEART